MITYYWDLAISVIYVTFQALLISLGLPLAVVFCGFPITWWVAWFSFLIFANFAYKGIRWEIWSMPPKSAYMQK